MAAGEPGSRPARNSWADQSARTRSRSRVSGGDSPEFACAVSASSMPPIAASEEPMIKVTEMIRSTLMPTRIAPVRLSEAARMLLPRPVSEDQDEEDPRAELVRRLPGVQRHQDDAALGRGEEGVEVLEAVVGQDRGPVALLEAAALAPHAGAAHRPAVHPGHYDPSNQPARGLTQAPAPGGTGIQWAAYRDSFRAGCPYKTRSINSINRKQGTGK